MLYDNHTMGYFPGEYLPGVDGGGVNLQIEKKTKRQ